MNQLNCSENFAVDNTLSLSAARLSVTCSVPTPFYIFSFTAFIASFFIIAFVRTTMIIKKKPSSQTSKGKMFKTRVLKMIALVRSWLTFFDMVLIAILPFALQNVQNVIVILLGIEYVLFFIACENWLLKLVRLGKRIIPKGSKRTDDSSNREHDQLSEFDVLLTFLLWIMRIGITFQLITLCILAAIFPEQHFWLQIGVGMTAVLIFTFMCAINYQYYRCETCIKESQKNIESILTSNDEKLRQVRQKFHLHQSILWFFGILGSLIFLLFAVEILPLNWILLVVTSFLDVAVNGSMLITFMKRRKQRNEESRLRSASGSFYRPSQQQAAVISNEPSYMTGN